MASVIETVKSAKEPLSYVAMSVGAGMTIGQVIGFVIGIGGLIVAIFRCRIAYLQQKEAEKANDLDREKWEYEKNAKSKDNQEAKEKTDR